MKRPKIGLVLGGGGSRGMAHIGVLRVLIREQIPIDLIVGTSMGAIVGVLYALGYGPAEIAEGLTAVQSNFLLNILGARTRQRKIREQLAPMLDGKTFADLNVPVIMMAVDMVHGREVTLSKGPLLPAVLASSAVPGAFPPVKLNGMELADGGVIDSLATHVAYDRGADKIIAVDVYPALDKEDPWTDPLSAIMGFQLPVNIFSTSGNGIDRIPTAPAAMWRAVRVITWYLHEQRLAEYPAHVLLRPNVGNYGSLDFKNLDGPLTAGIVEAEDHLPALKALVHHLEPGPGSG